MLYLWATGSVGQGRRLWTFRLARVDFSKNAWKSKG